MIITRIRADVKWFSQVGRRRMIRVTVDAGIEKYLRIPLPSFDSEHDSIPKSCRKKSPADRNLRAKQSNLIEFVLRHIKRRKHDRIHGKPHEQQMTENHQNLVELAQFKADKRPEEAEKQQKQRHEQLISAADGTDGADDDGAPECALDEQI